MCVWRPDGGHSHTSGMSHQPAIVSLATETMQPDRSAETGPVWLHRWLSDPDKAVLWANNWCLCGSASQENLTALVLRAEPLQRPGSGLRREPGHTKTAQLGYSYDL